MIQFVTSLLVSFILAVIIKSTVLGIIRNRKFEKAKELLSKHLMTLLSNEEERTKESISKTGLLILAVYRNDNAKNMRDDLKYVLADNNKLIDEFETLGEKEIRNAIYKMYLDFMDLSTNKKNIKNAKM